LLEQVDECTNIGIKMMRFEVLAFPQIHCELKDGKDYSMLLIEIKAATDSIVERVT
jgi:hypothetical protein